MRRGKTPRSAILIYLSGTGSSVLSQPCKAERILPTSQGEQTEAQRAWKTVQRQSKLEIKPVETCLVLTPRKSLTSPSGKAPWLTSLAFLVLLQELLLALP